MITRMDREPGRERKRERVRYIYTHIYDVCMTAAIFVVFETGLNKRMRSMKELADECKRVAGTLKHQTRDFDNIKMDDLSKVALDLGVAQVVNRRKRSKEELADECKRALWPRTEAARYVMDGNGHTLSVGHGPQMTSGGVPVLSVST